MQCSFFTASPSPAARQHGYLVWSDRTSKKLKSGGNFEDIFAPIAAVRVVPFSALLRKVIRTPPSGNFLENSDRTPGSRDIQKYIFPVPGYSSSFQVLSPN